VEGCEKSLHTLILLDGLQEWHKSVGRPADPGQRGTENTSRPATFNGLMGGGDRDHVEASDLGLMKGPTR
jgi:hypothetical protein